MQNNLTYQDILAEQYRQNQEAEDVVQEEEVHDEILLRDPRPEEIEEKDGFNKPGHNLGESIIQGASDSYQDKTVNSVKYLTKDILRSVLNIDSRFRVNQTITMPTNYDYVFQKPFRNVTSMRVSSIEFPNTSYTFSSERKNTTFSINYGNVSYSASILTTQVTVDVTTITIDPTTVSGSATLKIGETINIINSKYAANNGTFIITNILGSTITFNNPRGISGDTTGTVYIDGFVSITIPDGSYDDPSTLVAAIQSAVSAKISSDIQVSLSLTTGKVTFSTLTGLEFSLNFSTEYTQYTVSYDINGTLITKQNPAARSLDTGIGYNLGFTGVINSTGTLKIPIYTGKNSYTADSIVISIDSNYVFLSLGNDYPVLIHQYNTHDRITAFAKIFLTVPSFAVVFDSGQNTVTGTFYFKKPQDLRKISIKVYDVYGKIVDTNGVDFSFTLEIDEIISNSLYRTLTDGT
jgi:hypothetical protein